MWFSFHQAWTNQADGYSINTPYFNLGQFPTSESVHPQSAIDKIYVAVRRHMFGSGVPVREVDETADTRSMSSNHGSVGGSDRPPSGSRVRAGRRLERCSRSSTTE